MSNAAENREGKTLTVTRAAKRHKVFVPSKMLLHSGEERVHILDISQAGARTFGSFTAKVGDLVELTVGDEQVTARVRWVKDRTFGLEFDPEMDQAAIDQLLKR
ncbi:PilZ domain-containing protein [Stakelama marina]|uniref:PilZ domain-containing protein n=1 Tax=Stakelama marina TaxID=2826939 RepID=A0A8T4ICC4_9SPHN|nr:PilZ domain-containing protein [Stakelama marina]MBR0551752.1 PilZ domain-containing protein [Stakelama marina]